ncbi:MAG: DUF72 domain-containing protein, partial [Alphaproteobacteria bacterium]
WVYVRGHGPGGTYHGSYGDHELRKWARHVRTWRKSGADIFCYFDNDPEAAAPRDALRLKTMLARAPQTGLRRIHNMIAPELDDAS